MTQAELGAQIRLGKTELARLVVNAYFERHPDFKSRYGADAYKKSLQDAEYHFVFLAEALETEEPILFLDYIHWNTSLFESIGLPIQVLIETIQLMIETLNFHFGSHDAAPACILLGQSIEHINLEEPPQHNFIDETSPLGPIARRYLEALLAADRRKAGAIIEQAIQNGSSIKDIYLEVFQKTQQEIGRLWQLNQISVAQEHFCSAATQMIMAQLYPMLFKGEVKQKHIIVACVGGELHELGARMVADIFELEGWDSYFIGANTPLRDLLRTITEKKTELVALSVTMTYHLSELKEYIRELHKSSSNLKIMVGGYPFNMTPTLWQKVGADGWASDAVQAVQVAERLLV
ncbi:MAG TPA: cobalamin-dependent protein [Termitinemataceae bacterium]|nr:cobalamin-dependent protein [Termitinemataceae bacterium]HOM23832.1 cobalamin-dependent protein [Termitinemataceae bacterium]HPP99904.1 cobalamin-dependent protein [Termitinemataceae bacterium]